MDAMHSSKPLFKAWVFTFLVMLAIDALWLGVVARDLYRQDMGILMAAQPRWAAAAAFYLAYPLGLVIFAVKPALETASGGSGGNGGNGGSLGRALLLGGLFGLFAYGTYDLTNLAVVQDWPLRLTFVDLAWGTFASAVSAGAGLALTRWWIAR